MTPPDLRPLTFALLLIASPPAHSAHVRFAARAPHTDQCGPQGLGVGTCTPPKHETPNPASRPPHTPLVPADIPCAQGPSTCAAKARSPGQHACHRATTSSAPPNATHSSHQAPRSSNDRRTSRPGRKARDSEAGRRASSRHRNSTPCNGSNASSSRRNAPKAERPPSSTKPSTEPPANDSHRNLDQLRTSHFLPCRLFS